MIHISDMRVVITAPPAPRTGDRQPPAVLRPRPRRLQPRSGAAASRCGQQTDIPHRRECGSLLRTRWDSFVACGALKPSPQELSFAELATGATYFDMSMLGQSIPPIAQVRADCLTVEITKVSSRGQPSISQRLCQLCKQNLDSFSVLFTNPLTLWGLFSVDEGKLQ